MFARKSATRPLATSPRQNVYDVGGGYATGGKTCGGPGCRETFRVYSVVPSSALGVEMSKPLYPYFGALAISLPAPSTGLAGLPVEVQAAIVLYVSGRARTLVRG